MRIAIVGTGISGLVCAHLLQHEHDLTLFEADDRIGGHTHTVDETSSGKEYAVDTGFIVFNDWTYPNFIKLIDQLGVPSQPSDMSFSVRSEKTGLEWTGSTLSQLFVQRKNLFSPSFYRMVLDMLRFNRNGPKLLESQDDVDLTLAEYVERENYSNQFVRDYLIPMGASIWSANPETFLEMPARFLIGFFKNHGMMQIRGRPQWRVIKGGSREYVKKLIEPIRDRIHTNSPVESITRRDNDVLLKAKGHDEQTFDQVIIATHSDQALRMLSDPTDAEREILEAIPFQPNDVVLHTDQAMLPTKREGWAAWNYHDLRDRSQRAALTYDMNILQSLDAKDEFCVTLNRNEDIDGSKIRRKYVYDHPVYNTRSIGAQKRWEEINGVRRTYYCGAYWSYGFHEDGVKSALRVCEKFDQRL